MSHDVIKKHTDRALTLTKAAKDCMTRPSIQGSKDMNQEDAVYFFYQAHVSWRIIQEWEEAANCIQEASEGMWRLGEKHESLMSLSICAELRERVNPFDSIDVYAKLISMACDLSRYKDAGRYQLRIAELHEECRNYEDAITAYRDAARFYTAEMMTQEAHNCMIKYATMCADLEEYDIAFDALIELAKHCLKSNLTKFNARSFLFKAGLTLVAQGRTEELKQALIDFADLDHSFVNSRECLFLQALIDVRSPINMDKFADDIYDYDTVAPFDSWSLRMLKRFKVHLDQDVAIDNVRKEQERKVKEQAIAEAKKKRHKLKEGNDEREGEASGGVKAQEDDYEDVYEKQTEEEITEGGQDETRDGQGEEGAAEDSQEEGNGTQLESQEGLEDLQDEVNYVDQGTNGADDEIVDTTKDNESQRPNE